MNANLHTRNVHKDLWCGLAMGFVVVAQSIISIESFTTNLT